MAPSHGVAHAHRREQVHHLERSVLSQGFEAHHRAVVRIGTAQGERVVSDLQRLGYDEPARPVAETAARFASQVTRVSNCRVRP
jgi:hypothetical protein